MDFKSLESTDLDKQTKNELIVVAKSVGVKHIGTKKTLIERINEKIQEYKNGKNLDTPQIKQEKQDSNKPKPHKTSKKVSEVPVAAVAIVPPTPAPIIDLYPIKDMDIVERLFWKIFRHKVLFKQVKLHWNSRFHSYYHINDISYMVNNGYKGLLIDKVKKKLPLVDTSDYTNYWYRDIFKFIIYKKQHDKNQQEQDIEKAEITEFYQTLFINYKRYFINYQDIIKSIVEKRNLIALQVLLTNGNNQLSDELLVKLLSISSEQSDLKMFRYLVNEYLDKPNNQQFKETIINRFLTGGTQNLSNGFEGIKSNFSIKYVNPKRAIQFPKFLLHLLNSNLIIENDRVANSSIMVPNLIEYILPDCVFTNYKLSKLIHACKLLFKLFEPSNDSITQFNQILALESSFTKNELKTNIQILLNQTGNNGSVNGDLVKSLIHFYYTVSTINFPNIYFLNFGFDVIISKSRSSNNTFIIEDSCILALEYGNHKLINICLNEKNSQSKIINQFLNQEYPNTLLKHCDNGTKRIEFVTELIKDITSKKSQAMNPILLLHLLICYNDIELVKMAIQQMGGIDNFSLKSKFYNSNYSELKRIDNSSNPLSILNLQRVIRSVEMLTYCFQNLNGLLCQKNNIISWYALGRTDLISSYETLIGYESCKSLLLDFVKIQPPLKHLGVKYFGHLWLKTIVYIIGKPHLYQHDNSVFKFIELSDNKQSLPDIQSIIQFSNQQLQYNIFDKVGSKILIQPRTIELSNWLFEFSNGTQINSKRCQFSNFLSILLVTDRLDDNIINTIAVSETELYQFALLLVVSDDLILADHFIKIHIVKNRSNANKIMIIVEKLLVTCITNGKLEVFDHIYSSLLKNKVKVNNATVNKLFEEIVEHDQIHIFDYFVNKLRLSFGPGSFHDVIKNCEINSKDNLILNCYQSLYGINN